MKNKKENRVLRYYHLLLVTCMFFISSCSSSSSSVKHYTRPDMDSSTINIIAVLPFENLTDDQYAHEKIRSLVNIDLLERGLDIIEPGEVLRAMGEEEIRSAKSLSTTDIQNLGEALNVGSLITGSVVAFEMSTGINVTYPEVSVSMRMYDTATGDTAWSVWHTTGGASFWTRHIGAEGATLDETSREVIKEAIDTLF